MVAENYVALECTLFAEETNEQYVRLWNLDCKVHDRGKELLVPGAGGYCEHDILVISERSAEKRQAFTTDRLEPISVYQVLLDV